MDISTVPDDDGMSSQEHAMEMADSDKDTHCHDVENTSCGDSSGSGSGAGIGDDSEEDNRDGDGIDSSCEEESSEEVMMDNVLMQSLNSLANQQERGESLTRNKHIPSGLKAILERLGRGLSSEGSSSGLGYPALIGLSACLEGLDAYDESVILHSLRQLSELISLQSELMMFDARLYKELKACVGKLHHVLSLFAYNGEIALLAVQCLLSLLDCANDLEQEMQRVGIVREACLRLHNIEYIDVAEQSILLLEKLAPMFPADILREGGLVAALSVMDFFALSIQQHVMTLATHLCECKDIDSAEIQFRDSFPMLKSLLLHADASIVEQSCKCLANIVASIRAETSFSTRCLLDTSNVIEIVNILSSRTTAFYSSTIAAPLLSLLRVSIKQNPPFARDMLSSQLADVLVLALKEYMPLSSRSLSGMECVRKPFDNFALLMHLYLSLLPLPTPELSNYFLALPKPLSELMGYGDWNLCTRPSDLCRPAVMEKFRIVTPALIEFMRNPINRAYYEPCLLILLQIVACVPASTLADLLSDDTLAALFVIFSHILVIFDIKGTLLVLVMCQLWLQKGDVGLPGLFVRHGIADQIRALGSLGSKHLSFDRIRFSMRQAESLRQCALDWHDKECELLASFIAEQATTLCRHFFDMPVDRARQSPALGRLLFFAGELANASGDRLLMRELSSWLATADPTPFELFKSGLLESLLDYFLSKAARLETLANRLAELYYALQAMPSTWQIFFGKLQSLIDRHERLPLFASSLFDPNRPLSALRALARPVRVQLTELSSSIGNSELSIELTLSPLMTMESLEPYVRRLKSIAAKDPKSIGQSDALQRHLISNAFHAFSNIFPDDDDDGIVSGSDAVSEQERESDEQSKRAHVHKRSAQHGDRQDNAGLRGADKLYFCDFASSSSSGKEGEKTSLGGYSIQFFMGSKRLEKRSIVYHVVAATDMEKEHGLRSPDVAALDKIASLRKKRTSWSTAYRISFKLVQGVDCPGSPSAATAPLPYQMESERVLLQCFLAKIHDACFAHLQGGAYYAENAKRLFGTSSVEDFRSSKSYALLLLTYFHFALEYGYQFVRSVGTRLSSISLVNTVLTTKCLYMMQGPMTSTGAIIPEWLRFSLKNMPFLYSSSAKTDYFRAHHQGIARTLTYLHQVYRANRLGAGAPARHSSTLLADPEQHVKIGRMRRIKTKVSRRDILGGAKEVFLFATRPGHEETMLEVEFQDEVGTGLGPTLEYYSLVCSALKSASLGLWMNTKPTQTPVPDRVLDDRKGLFLRPIDESTLSSVIRASRVRSLETMGLLIGKSMLDRHAIDLNLHPILLDALLQRPVLITWATLHAIDPEFADSLHKLYVLSPSELASLELTFTHPMDDGVSLKPDGRHSRVEADTLDEYVRLAIAWTLNHGIAWQLDVIRTTLARVIDTRPLPSLFTGEEMGAFLTGDRLETPWTRAEILASVRTAHGYNLDSLPVQYLVEVMCEMNLCQRKALLFFLTGASNLPAGGLQALEPHLTIVKKLPDSSKQSSDNLLPSVMTCANYLKLPAYSSKASLQQKLYYAMEEGHSSFHLS